MSISGTLAGLIGHVAPHLVTGVPASDPRRDAYTSWSSSELRPGASRLHDAGTLLTCVVLDGEAPYKNLRDWVSRSTWARRFWGNATQDDMIARALDAVAQKTSNPTTAAGLLLSELQADPPESTFAFRIYGIAPDQPTRVAGTTFCFRDPNRFASELGASIQHIRLALGDRLPWNRDAIAIAAGRGDEQRGPLNALERIRMAMAVLACIAADTAELAGEADFGLGDTDFAVALKVDGDQVAAMDLDRDIHSGLWADQDEIDAALKQRPGLRSLCEIAAALPMEPVSRNGPDLDGRILRAALALSASFTGAPAERLLWRWIAIEALLGDSRPELSDRLSDRVAVLITDGPELRAERRRDVKKLYGLRSAIAHGGSLSSPDEHDAARLRSIAAQCLERTAGLRSLRDSDALFDALEAARYTATSAAGAP